MIQLWYFVEWFLHLPSGISNAKSSKLRSFLGSSWFNMLRYFKRNTMKLSYSVIITAISLGCFWFSNSCFAGAITVISGGAQVDANNFTGKSP
jgi:hypothetical protein